MGVPAPPSGSADGRSVSRLREAGGCGRCRSMPRRRIEEHHSWPMERKQSSIILVCTRSRNTGSAPAPALEEDGTARTSAAVSKKSEQEKNREDREGDTVQRYQGWVDVLLRRARPLNKPSKHRGRATVSSYYSDWDGEPQSGVLPTTASRGSEILSLRTPGCSLMVVFQIQGTAFSRAMLPEVVMAFGNNYLCGARFLETRESERLQSTPNGENELSTPRNIFNLKDIVRAQVNVVDPYSRDNSRTRRMKKARLDRVIRLKPPRHRIEGTSFPDTRRSRVAGQVLPHGCDASGNMEEENVHGTGQPPNRSVFGAVRVGRKDQRPATGALPRTSQLQIMNCELRQLTVTVMVTARMDRSDDGMPAAANVWSRRNTVHRTGTHRAGWMGQARTVLVDPRDQGGLLRRSSRLLIASSRRGRRSSKFHSRARREQATAPGQKHRATAPRALKPASGRTKIQWGAAAVCHRGPIMGKCDVAPPAEMRQASGCSAQMVKDEFVAKRGQFAAVTVWSGSPTKVGG
ncbi:hypothetical protein C8Q74DRAFT_1214353 [Fomes fomentarius]|nr:hypothetical protein C8Q74DRAFT_1214353 [Fomes fomentarius]